MNRVYEIKNISLKGDDLIVEDYNFDEMKKLFDQLSINYEIEVNPLFGNSRIIKYKDYNKYIVNLVYNENGNLIYKYKGWYNYE